MSLDHTPIRRGTMPAPKASSLRLVGRSAPAPKTRSRTASDSPVPQGPRISGATDPRWVLAVRVSQQLEGPILRAERRERLIKTGKLLGLSPFDANLIIAIVQDQARRGYEPDYCPTAGEPQLAMVPLPNVRQRLGGKLANGKFLRIIAIAAAIIIVELVLLKILL